MYELLTGQRLFDGETDYATVKLVREAVVPSLIAQNPDVTPELETIVRRALARDRNQRYQRVEELLEAIAHYLFSRGMKVTSRDIEQLIGRVLAERQKSKPQPQSTLIDNLIQDEILRFTSLDEVGTSSKNPAKDRRRSIPISSSILARGWPKVSRAFRPAHRKHRRPVLGWARASRRSSRCWPKSPPRLWNPPATPPPSSVSAGFRSRKPSGPPLVPIIMAVVTVLLGILGYLLLRN